MPDLSPTAAAPDDAAGDAPSLRGDLLSAYAATLARIGSWVVVSAIVYRYSGRAEFAVLALIRGTIGILNYTTLGLSPAMIRMLAEAKRARPPAADDEVTYFNASREGLQSMYANGMLIALMCGALGLAVSLAYALRFNHLFGVPPHLIEQAPIVAALMGCGTVLRLMGDAPGAVLQSHQRMARDNLTVAAGEALWGLHCCLMPLYVPEASLLNHIAMSYLITGGAALVIRDLLASNVTGFALPRWRLIDGATLARLLAFGSLVLFAQLADYLYAPTDYILINRLLGWDQVAVYTPAMQIDSGLLLLVTGLSSVILPRTALAHTAGDRERVRRYYVVGTLASGFLLALAALAVYLASPLIFRLWLGDPMRPTQAILPLVLLHTVVGGSGAVGRSILLGMGKVRAFTIAVLIAGVANVALSYAFVRYLDLGLKGIVYGTVIVVIARAGIWTPWYVLRTLRADDVQLRGGLRGALRGELPGDR